MVRNTILEEEGSVQSKLKEAIFEPKMTRSKLREVMDKGQIPVSVCIAYGTAIAFLVAVAMSFHYTTLYYLLYIYYYHNTTTIIVYVNILLCVLGHSLLL